MKKQLLFILALAGFTVSTNAQWVENNVGITAGHYVNYLSVPNANAVWGTTIDATSGTAPSTRRWVRSNDGGATWSTGLVTGATSTYEASSITSINGDTAWVSMFNSSGGGKIFRTNNGGATWAAQTTATFTAPAGFPNVVHFWDANSGFSMGDPNGGYYEIYTTLDGGTTWTRVPTGNIPAPLAGEYGYVNAFDVVGDNVWFVTNMGRVYRSIDRGINWTASATIFSDAGEVKFTTAMDGIVEASGGTALQFTNDGGLTWNDLIYSGTVFSYDIDKVQGTPGMYVSTGEDPAATGTYGSSYSLDNGNTWIVIDADQHITVKFLDINTGWSGAISAGATGGIYKWTGASIGISSINEVSEMNIYPNPGNGIFTIKFPSTLTNSLVSIFDAKGKLVSEVKQNDMSEIIDISSQSHGIYFVKIQNDNEIITKKIIIE